MKAKRKVILVGGGQGGTGKSYIILAFAEWQKLSESKGQSRLKQRRRKRKGKKS
jgi:hypothetical protein